MHDRVKELKEQVKKGKIRAALELAEAFKWGIYSESDPRRAARYYRICCRSKDKETASKGYYHLGELYYFGYCDPEGKGRPDPARAFHCFLKSCLVSANRDSLRRLGDMYRYGQYVEKNESVALSLYLKANASV